MWFELLSLRESELLGAEEWGVADLDDIMRANPFWFGVPGLSSPFGLLFAL